MTQWLLIHDKTITRQDDTFLEQLLEQEQCNITDQFIKMNQTIMNLSSSQQQKLFDPVNFKAWYFLFFMYNDFSKSVSAPVIVKSKHYKEHIEMRQSTTGEIKKDEHTESTNYGRKRTVNDEYR